MSMRAIIIDDEALNRRSLRTMLERSSTPVEVVAMANGVQTGIAAIEKEQPDLVLLDVRLSPGSGFDVLAHFENPEFSVIFTTAFSEYALAAIKASAIDYLLKPIDEQELNRSLEKARKMLGNQGIAQRLKMFSGNMNQLKQIAIPSAEGFLILATEDIEYCQANRNYTWVFLKNGEKHLVCRTLKHFQKVLPKQSFFRPHQSYLINLSQVKEYKRRKKGGLIFMKSNVEIPLAERKKKDFQGLF